MEEQLVKYFSGNLTSEEKQKIEEWRCESDTNASEFLEFHRAWKFSAELEIDAKGALNTIMSRIEDHEGVVKSANFSIGTYFKYAAVAILAIGVLFFGREAFVKAPQQLAVESLNNLEIIALPDGSVVTLSENSSLSYSEKFVGDTRSVTLKGKAFFDVKRDESKPFIVNTDQSKIEVLGTSFLVNTESENALTEVMVKTGRVAVSKKESRPSEKIELIAGEVGRLVEHAGVFEKSTIENYNYLAWKTKLIEFNNEELSSVLETLREVYSVKIVVSNEKIYDCHMSAKFDNQPVESVLEILSRTFNLDLTKSGKNEFFLSGEGCIVVQ
ncbi:FecR family protein [Reichenbachiella faecimaris]|uniref:FecR family protein n=1 Tax=Reichenbachiella faecimaris TaxID=692418 RepID=A0A1W2GMY6_REIFA|nr:FecR domain-containing protein [Reichenbachiella faecimaris]SMD38025.1 FecR family protein [Reichenbachiella faecimaris]